MFSVDVVVDPAVTVNCVLVVTIKENIGWGLRFGRTKYRMIDNSKFQNCKY